MDPYQLPSNHVTTLGGYKNSDYQSFLATAVAEASSPSSIVTIKATAVALLFDTDGGIKLRPSSYLYEHICFSL